ncbi:MAG: hypothetical protein U0230_24090 [Polyangiales bacterium]
MARYLLAYVSSDFTDEVIEHLRSLVKNLATNGAWSREPPDLVDQMEEDSATRPEDEPLRTVGVVLVVSDPGAAEETPVSEPARLVDALSTFSKQQAVDFELQLGETYVGEIRSGVPDELIREGLLARW